MFGLGGGGGGLLSGLKGGFSNLMQGQTPVLKDVAGPGIMDERRGMIKPPISLEDTGEKTGGLLSKVANPDPRGLTFGDKLFAAGSILQGDSGGAATYLANQRNAADALNERARSRGIAERSAKAFRSLVGELPENVRRYVEEMGPDLDPKEAMSMASSLAPKVSVQNAGGGGLYELSQGPFGGGVTSRELVAPPPRKQGVLNDDGTINEELLQAEARKAELLAAARRRGAPPIGRGGGGGGRKSPWSGASDAQLEALLAGG